MSKSLGQAYKEKLKGDYESNAEVQRNRTMTKSERASHAVDLMTDSVKQFNDHKAGRDTTESEARKKAIEIAERADRERK